MDPIGEPVRPLQPYFVRLPSRSREMIAMSICLTGI